MLELYHHGSSVCAAKVQIALEEKDLEFEKHYIDILKGEQFTPKFLAINPKALVPVLLHDGQIITESTVICEYLDRVFPEKPIMPSDPLLRAKVQYWTKAVDEEVHPACGTLTFVSSHRYTVMKLGKEGLKEFLDSTPQMSLASDWKERKRAYIEQGLPHPDAKKAVHVHEIFLDKMEKTLANGDNYLVGNIYTMADIAMTPYVNRLNMLSMLKEWCTNKPNVLKWFDRIRARPKFVAAVDQYLPEDLANDLRANGAKSWPEVKAILQAE